MTEPKANGKPEPKADSKVDEAKAANEKQIAELSKKLVGVCKKIKAADGLTAERNSLLVEMHSLGSRPMELAENVDGSLSKARIIQIVSAAKKQS